MTTMTTIKLLPANPARIWDLTQVKMFVRQVKERTGEQGWNFLSQSVQEALIAEKALFIVTGLERGSIDTASIGCLRRDMFIVAGLLTVE